MQDAKDIKYTLEFNLIIRDNRSSGRFEVREQFTLESTDIYSMLRALAELHDHAEKLGKKFSS